MTARHLSGAAVVARKEFRDARRSRLLWALAAVFSILVGGAILAFYQFTDTSPATAFGSLLGPAELLVPIVGVVVGYMAIVGERRSGSLRVLLGYPVTRGGVFAGKLCGRLAVTVLTALVGFGVGGLVTLVAYGRLPITEFLGLALATTALAAAFVGLSVGISGAVVTRGRSMGLSIATVLTTLVLWNPLVAGVYALASGGPPGEVVPAWYFLLRRLNPLRAYELVVGELLTSAGGGIALTLRPPAATRRPLVEQIHADAVPGYLDPWVAVAVLLAWTVLPALVGYVRFRRADLS